MNNKEGLPPSIEAKISEEELNDNPAQTLDSFTLNEESPSITNSIISTQEGAAHNINNLIEQTPDIITSADRKPQQSLILNNEPEVGYTEDHIILTHKLHRPLFQKIIKNLPEKYKRFIIKSGTINNRPIFRYHKTLVEKILEIRNTHLYFHQKSGYILQYAIEVIIKVLGNQEVDIEKPYILPRSNKEIVPDFLKLPTGCRLAPIVADSKLKTTTFSMEETIKNYGELITGEVLDRIKQAEANDERPNNIGYILLVCLNGEKKSKPEIRKLEKMINKNKKVKLKIHFYYITDILEKFLKLKNNNKRSLLVSHVLNFFNYSKNKELSLKELNKLEEIYKVLLHIKSLLETNSYDLNTQITKADIDRIFGTLHYYAKEGDLKSIMKMNFENI